MTVYVIQQQMRFDQEKRELVPRFSSISKAEKWGKLEFVLSPSVNPFNPSLFLGDIHEKLKSYNDNDYLLLIGGPSLIGMATAIAAHYNNGMVRFLQWSGRHEEYSEIPVQIY